MNVRYLFVLLAFLSSSNLVAEVKNVTGKITEVQLQSKNYTTYSTAGEAIAFIWMDELPASCGNSSNFKRVAITSEHPAFNIVVSASLAAKAADQTVQIFYVDQCTLWNNNAWDFSIFKTL